MEIICINAEFSQNVLEWYSRVGVTIPTKDTIYTIRGCERTFNGLGLWLEEIVNPIVDVRGMTGIIKKEVSFSHTRFTNLLGEPLSIEKVLESVKTDVKELVTVGTNQNNN